MPYPYYYILDPIHTSTTSTAFNVYPSIWTTAATQAVNWYSVYDMQQQIAAVNAVMHQQLAAAQQFPYPQRQLSRPPQRPAIIHSGRELVDRQISLYRRMRPADEITRLLRGYHVTIAGRLFRYRFQLRSHDREALERLSERVSSAHIPFALGLLHPTIDQVVATGCTIVRDTPVIDQVLAAVLAVTDPRQERAFIYRTNWAPALPGWATERLSRA